MNQRFIQLKKEKIQKHSFTKAEKKEIKIEDKIEEKPVLQVKKVKKKSTPKREPEAKSLGSKIPKPKAEKKKEPRVSLAGSYLKNSLTILLNLSGCSKNGACPTPSKTTNLDFGISSAIYFDVSTLQI